MKFTVETNFLVRVENEIDIKVEQFLHCATIEELFCELKDYIYNKVEHPKVDGLVESELLGLEFHDRYYQDVLHNKSFFDEWQKLKGLPKEL
jgi:hypothetical protein